MKTHTWQMFAVSVLLLSVWHFSTLLCLQVANGKWKRRSFYCPLDLFSGWDSAAFKTQLPLVSFTIQCHSMFSSNIAVTQSEGKILWLSHSWSGMMHSLCSQSCLWGVCWSVLSVPLMLWSGAAVWKGGWITLWHSWLDARVPTLFNIPDVMDGKHLATATKTLSGPLSEIRVLWSEGWTHGLIFWWVEMWARDSWWCRLCTMMALDGKFLVLICLLCDEVSKH